MKLRIHSGLAAFGLAMNLAAGTARCDVVAVVSSKTTVSALTKSEVADIFLGKVGRFPDGSRAIPIDQAEDTLARNEFYMKITGKSAAQIKAFWSKIIFTGRGEPPKSVSNGIEVKKVIHENPSVIGYIDEKMVDDSVRVVL